LTQIDHQLASPAVDQAIDGILGVSQGITEVQAAEHLDNRDVADLLDLGFYHSCI